MRVFDHTHPLERAFNLVGHSTVEIVFVSEAHCDVAFLSDGVVGLCGRELLIVVVEVLQIPIHDLQVCEARGERERKQSVTLNRVQHRFVVWVNKVGLCKSKWQSQKA